MFVKIKMLIIFFTASSRLKMDHAHHNHGIDHSQHVHPMSESMDHGGHEDNTDCMSMHSMVVRI